MKHRLFSLVYSLFIDTLQIIAEVKEFREVLRKVNLKLYNCTFIMKNAQKHYSSIL